MVARLKIYYIKGPYSDPYLVGANSEQEALDMCVNYEWMTYDLWACYGYGEDGEWYEDYFCSEYDFESISLDEFNTYRYYKDLINYNFKYDSLCNIVENKKYKEINNMDHDPDYVPYDPYIPHNEMEIKEWEEQQKKIKKQQEELAKCTIRTSIEYPKFHTVGENIREKPKPYIVKQYIDSSGNILKTEKCRMNN